MREAKEKEEEEEVEVEEVCYTEASKHARGSSRVAATTTQALASCVCWLNLDLAQKSAGRDSTRSIMMIMVISGRSKLAALPDRHGTELTQFV